MKIVNIVYIVQVELLHVLIKDKEKLRGLFEEIYKEITSRE